jgi:hypothetical protein
MSQRLTPSGHLDMSHRESRVKERSGAGGKQAPRAEPAWVSRAGRGAGDLTSHPHLLVASLGPSPGQSLRSASAGAIPAARQAG